MDLVTFTEEILNGEVFFFCSVEQISGKESHKIVPYLVAAFSVFSH